LTLQTEENEVLEELKEEGIVNKVGGRFKLSTLIQKRMIMLNTGARPLVDIRGNDKMTVVIQEILQNKIYLDASDQVQTNAGPGDIARRAMMSDISADLGSGDD
jgi:DNA-directed RNA polymerase subunit omega